VKNRKAFAPRPTGNAHFVTHRFAHVECRDEKTAVRAGLPCKIHRTNSFSIARCARAW
jgi:hypothetical protein